MDEEKIVTDVEVNDESVAEPEKEVENKTEETVEYGPFFGRGYHSVDDKNRIKFPVEIRDQLDKRAFRLVKGPKHKINVYTAEEADKKLLQLKEMLDKNPSNKVMTKVFKDFASSMTPPIIVDTQDRFNCPQWLMDWAEIKKKDQLVTAGFVDHLEIWRQDKFAEEYESITDEEYEDALELIGVN